MHSVSGIGKEYREKLRLVLESNPKTLTSSHVSRVLNVSRQEAGRILSRWYKSGWVSRIKRGVYVPLSVASKTNSIVLEEPNLIADSLYGPGYIGGFTAVKHWDFSEQIIEAITYYTLKKVKNRNPTHGGIKFTLKTTSNYKVFGLKNIWYGSHKVRISDPTKTIIDILDDPKVVGGIRVAADILGEYMSSDDSNIGQLIEYGKKMKNRTIFKRLGFLFEVRFNMREEVTSKLRDLISPNYTDLDSTLKCNHLVKKWQLKVSSSWMQEYDRKK